MKFFISVIILIVITSGCAKNTSYKKTEQKKEVFPPVGFSQVGIIELRKALSGNTVICSLHKEDQIDMIWILDKMATPGTSDPAIEIDLNKKMVTNTEYGSFPAYTYYFGLGHIETYQSHTKKRKFYLNHNKTQLIIPYESIRKPKIKNQKNLTFNIIQGHPEEYIKLSKNKNFSSYTAPKRVGMFGVMIQKAAKAIATNDGNYRAASNYCSSSEKCYEVIQTMTNHTVIKCRNGSTNNIYYDPSYGKYYQQGFMVNNYERSFKKIANYSCGVF